MPSGDHDPATTASRAATRGSAHRHDRCAETLPPFGPRACVTRSAGARTYSTGIRLPSSQCAMLPAPAGRTRRRARPIGRARVGLVIRVMPAVPRRRAGTAAGVGPAWRRRWPWSSDRTLGRSRVRAMSVRYDPAFHGQPRSLPATLASRSALEPRLPVGFPS